MRAWIMAVLLPLAMRGQANPDALLRQARAKIVENAAKLPKYTCVQTIQRSEFQMFNISKKRTCEDRMATAKGPVLPQIRLAWTDRFKLDVTVAEGTEIFSWAGAREFQSSDAQEIVGGGVTGSGDFGPFLTDIFGGEATEFHYVGMERDHSRALAAYRYSVPRSASHYQIQIDPRGRESAMLGYEGEFWIDPQSAGLLRLTIVVPEPPAHAETCRIETEIDYRPMAIAGAPLLLPESTMLKLWDSDGSRDENQIAYDSCRAFQSESVFRPEMEGAASDTAAAAAPAARAVPTIPPGLTLQIALHIPIDMETAFGGDAAEGQLVDDLRSLAGELLAPRGTIVHGRVVRAARHFVPTSYFTLGLRFDSLSLGGMEIPLTVTHDPRSAEERVATGDVERRQGIGMFVFHGGLRVLDDGFISEWRTTAAKRP